MSQRRQKSKNERWERRTSIHKAERHAIAVKVHKAKIQVDLDAPETLPDNVGCS